MSDDLKYNLRGVSAAKEDVHAAIKNLDKGLFPNAFSKVFPDLIDNDPDKCLLMSSDGSGTKSILAYLYSSETGDNSVWRGIAQDALVMNLDDLICTGASGPFLYTSILNRNKNLISGEVIAEIIEGNRLFIEKLNDHGIPVVYTGGETADVGDLVRTITVDGSMMTKMSRNNVVNNEIKVGDVIVGIASFGQAKYEEEYNSGIGSNGLTSARHDVLSKYYGEKYPESVDPNTDESVVYEGKHRLTEEIENTGISVGKALLSPTRTYAPLLKNIVSEKVPVNAIIHCTGGGQSKVLHFMSKNTVIKDNLFDAPPVFNLIQTSSGADPKEMYQVFNMGQRLEFYLDAQYAEVIIDAAGDLGMVAQVVGRVEESADPKVIVRKEDIEVFYS
ncbi:MAG: phosphoribosylformylglycinamidine cyclo-ligase [Chitinophagales bacterium]|nr:phosphoribosylformylglycinamidine cyclo-ligase [Chitinophagales bacterium]